MTEGKDAQDQEVEGKEEIYIFLAEDVEEDVKSKQSTGGNYGKHHCILSSHSLRPLASFLLKQETNLTVIQ